MTTRDLTSSTYGPCSVYPPKVGTSSWRVRWRRNEKQHERTFPTKQAAEGFARKTAAEVSQGQEFVDLQMTVAEVAASYLETLPYGGYRDRQEVSFRVWVVPAIGRIKLTDWTPADSKALLRKMADEGLSDSYQRSIGAAMRSLVSYSQDKGWLGPGARDPMRGVRYAVQSKIQGESALFISRNDLPTDKDIDALCSVGTGHWPLAWKFLSRSGVRWSEMVALRPKDIDLEQRSVTVSRSIVESGAGHLRVKGTKNGRSRQTFFPQSLVEPMAAQMEKITQLYGPDGHLFPAPRGGPARRPQHRRLWQAAAKEAGWPMKSNAAGLERSLWVPHDLRHAAACWMIFDLKAELPMVTVWLGHHSPAFTMACYVGVRGDTALAAQELSASW